MRSKWWEYRWGANPIQSISHPIPWFMLPTATSTNCTLDRNTAIKHIWQLWLRTALKSFHKLLHFHMQGLEQHAESIGEFCSKLGEFILFAIATTTWIAGVDTVVPIPNAIAFVKEVIVIDGPTLKITKNKSGRQKSSISLWILKWPEEHAAACSEFWKHNMDSTI